MKKIAFVFAILIFILSCTTISTYASEIEEQIKGYDISSLDNFVHSEENYYTDTESVFDIAMKFIKGQEVLNVHNVLKALLKGFFNEASSCISIIVTIIATSLAFSLLDKMSSELGKSVSEIAFFVCYLILASLLLKAFGEATTLVISSIKSSAMFINASAPILISMLASSGAPSSASVINPVILLASEILTLLCEKLFVPLLCSAAGLYIVSEIDEAIKVSRFADFLKNTVKWCLCLVLTVFVGILGIQGFCAATLDGTAVKTARFIVGTAVPVVGGILTETIETVVGCSRVIKNATGAAGIIALLVIVSTPVLKILAVSTSFYFGSAIIEPIAGSRISNIMGKISSVISLMAAIVIISSMIFIICITMIMCVGNTM